MSLVSTEPVTVADLLEQLGNIPADRVRLRPPPGQATEADVLAEMTRKTAEYFDSGARLVWIIDPETRTATVYTSPEQSSIEDDTLDGGDVLPGFTAPLKALFAPLDQSGPVPQPTP